LLGAVPGHRLRLFALRVDGGHHEGETTLTSFILKILFSGLMIFTPSQDGSEMTVLLVAAGNGLHLSDGSALQQHKPLLIARAGACSGDCPTRGGEIAQFIYAD